MSGKTIDLSGKVAAVVGGGGGIGKAVTLALARAGASVALFDKDAESLGETAKELEALGVLCTAFEGDVLSVEALDAFYERLDGEFDRLDILVNVVGGVRRRAFHESSDEEDAQDVRRNYGYVVQSIKRAIPLIERHDRGGCVVNFSTIEAYRGAAGYSVYAGAKAGIANLTKALAVEYGSRGIRFNEIVPDTTPSQGNMNALPPEMTKKLFSMEPETLAASMSFYIPLGAAPEPEDLADAVLFLVSDMARMITGVAIPVDGGTGASKGFFQWPHGDGFGPAPMTGSAARLFGGDKD